MKPYCRRLIKIAALIVMPLTVGACSENNRRAASPLDATYWIEGKAYTLKEGKSRVEAAPDSATEITTSVYGPYANGDLNGDGVADTGVILMHAPGGSGTFYYAAAAIRKGGVYEGTHAFFLGDRIVPTDIEIGNSVMMVSYRDRRPEDSMAAEVSVDKTVRLVLKNDRLEHVNQLNGK
jgi:hypothetical protein